MKILIKNGNIVTSTDSYRSDILISDGKILRIEAGSDRQPADRIIDAEGCLIFPGGVDPHVHLNLPTPAGYSSDNFLTGSKAALYGGTTTLLDFVTPAKGESLTSALGKRIEEAKNSLIDFSFHITPVEWSDSTEKELKDCIGEGISSFKVYMAYKKSIGLNSNELIKVMNAVGKTGKTLMVHCELGDEIDALQIKFIKEHHSGPEYHSLSRPSELEAEAVKEAINLAYQSDCNLYIVHVSSKESLKYIEEAQSRGQAVLAETCPQYLLLNDSKYEGDFDTIAPFIISPPLRKKEDNTVLWGAISRGIIAAVGTDHCPFNLAQKEAGRSDFRNIPNGAGGIEHRLELLYTYGVLKKLITLNKMVDIFATRPAKIFGLYPLKGEIKIGSDADLVIWDPESENVISSGTHHQNCDTNIYEGFKTRGKPKYVMTCGRIAVENGIIVSSDIIGRFLKR